MAVAALKDEPIVAAPKAPSKPKQIVLLTVKPGYSITLQRFEDEYRSVSVNGRLVEEKKKAKSSRFGSSVDHILRVDDGPDMEKVREAAGYGFQFIEALPNAKIPAGHTSLWEMKKKDRTGYWGKLAAIEAAGHKKLTRERLDFLLEEWATEARKEA